MANSITPGGTSRSLFGVATGDIVTGGSIIGASFTGAGNNITNLSANNITSGRLVVARGGTGSSSFINNAIVFNRNNQLVSDNNLSWENNILTINNRDFLSDTSNYISSEANKLDERISNTDSIISEIITTNLNDTNANVSNYIVSTSNILIEYIKTEQANNLIYPATTRTLGGVKIGSGIYVNETGVISLTPEIIYIVPPVVENNVLDYTSVPRTDYNVYKFIYNPSIGTTFDRGNANSMILPVWCKFTEDSNNLLMGYDSIITSNINGSNIPVVINDGIRRIKNSGYMGNILTNLELYGDTNIRPFAYLRNSEYMPLDTTYLEFNYVIPEPVPPDPPVLPPPSFGKFESEFDINSIFKAYSSWALTMSLWLKVNVLNGGDEIIIVEFSNNDSINSRKLNINYADNKLTFYMDKIREPVSTVLNIFKNTWYHISWSIERREATIEIIVYINGVLRDLQNVANDYVSTLGFIKYIKNTLSSDANMTTYNFCVSDFKIYNYALTDDEKKELYSMNEYTKYIVDFKDSTRTICDIMAYGGGGGGCGGNSNYGGGAGKLVYVNDAYISSGEKTIKVGRGGSAFYSNQYNYQFATRGNDTSFENLVADGGGAVMNKIFDYQVSSNILYVSNYTLFLPSAPTIPINRIFASNYIITTTYTCNMASNVIGGCGSGNFAPASLVPIISDDFRRLVGNTSNIYFRGNAGGEYGGGGIGTAGTHVNGGEGLFGLNLNNINIDTDRYFNYSASINFKDDFNLTEDLVGGQAYIGCGGAGSNLATGAGGVSRFGYNAIHSGCGGNYGENGKHGALLLRYLTKIDKKIIPGFVGETSNYVQSSSNNLILYVNSLMSVSGALLWAKETSNIYYNLGNVGIGVEPNNFKLEVAGGNGITPEDATYTFGIHTSNYSNIDVVQNITNTDICAKFNSSIWTTGNVISSSDERIKKNIGDIQDDNALRMILNIEPKTYNYIDEREQRGRGRDRGLSNNIINEVNNEVNDETNNKVYGFIAQQIREVIPDAVKIQTEFIPNIFVVAEYNPEEGIITLPISDTANASAPLPPLSHRIKCYDMRDASANTIIVEVVEVISPIPPVSFKIKKIKYRDTKIFVYGTEVNDFHALNKEYINTLNVCAVQELHRKIVSQQSEIRELNDKVNVLLNYIDMSRMSALQDEINELKSRYDLIINYINLSN